MYAAPYAYSLCLLIYLYVKTALLLVDDVDNGISNAKWYIYIQNGLNFLEKQYLRWFTQVINIIITRKKMHYLWQGLPEGTAQKPASPRKWSMRNSSYKSIARLILSIHQVYSSASIAFQSYKGLEITNKYRNQINTIKKRWTGHYLLKHKRFFFSKQGIYYWIDLVLFIFVFRPIILYRFLCENFMYNPENNQNYTVCSTQQSKKYYL